MNRRILLAATLALALAPQTFAGTWLKTVAAAQKVAKEKNQLILVDMFAEWCGWCHRFEKEVFPSAVFQEGTKDIVLLRLDTEDRKEGTAMAQKFGITSLPTFLLLTPDLTAAGMIRGYAPPNDFARMLKETRDKHTIFTKRVKNEAAIEKDYVARLELARDFVSRMDFTRGDARLRKLTLEKKIPAALRDDAYYQLAVSQIMQGKTEDALRTARQLTAISKAGEAVENVRMLVGQIYMQQGNLPAAADEFRSFKKSFPDSPHIRNIDKMLPEIERRLSASGK
ncbi:MAG TPA: thioredoxin fold domain-containing protein [Thermoanaerobaculia bacterium]|nr:thioredoxin fold domain-containing protein [Thermoanaerobaculia bacterium]